MLINEYFYNAREYVEWRDRTLHEKREYWVDFYEKELESLYKQILFVNRHTSLLPNQNISYLDHEAVYIGLPTDPIEKRILHGRCKIRVPGREKKR